MDLAPRRPAIPKYFDAIHVFQLPGCSPGGYYFPGRERFDLVDKADEATLAIGENYWLELESRSLEI